MGQKSTGESQCRNSRQTSGLPTCTVKQTASTADAGTPGLGQVSVETPSERRDFRRARTASSQKHRCRDSWLKSGLPTVGTSDLRRDFQHRKLQKIILCAREVLECPNFYLINMLEHSIFLRPNNFASLFIVRRILNSKSKLKPLESVLSSSVFSTSRIEG